jgi:hypothetical protein
MLIDKVKNQRADLGAILFSIIVLQLMPSISTGQQWFYRPGQVGERLVGNDQNFKSTYPDINVIMIE